MCQHRGEGVGAALRTRETTVITVQMPSVAKGYSFEAQALSLGIDRPDTDGGKAGTSDINIGLGELSALQLVRQQDDRSPTLARFAMAGSSVGDVTVEVGDGGKPSLTITLERAFVVAWHVNGDSGGRPTEDLALVGNVIRMRTTGEPGSDFGWDVARGSAAH